MKSDWLTPRRCLYLTALLSLPAWFVILTQLYMQGILSYGWPMQIGSVQAFDCVNPGSFNCIRPNPPWLINALEWALLPNRLGILWGGFVFFLIYKGFPLRNATSLTRFCFWFSVVGYCVLGGMLLFSIIYLSLK